MHLVIVMHNRNDPMFSDRHAWANSADQDQTAVCHSVCIVWTHYSMVEPYSSNFRVITTNFLGVRIFRKFTVYTTTMAHHQNNELHLLCFHFFCWSAFFQPNESIPLWKYLSLCPRGTSFSTALWPSTRTSMLKARVFSNYKNMIGIILSLLLTHIVYIDN